MIMLYRVKLSGTCLKGGLLLTALFLGLAQIAPAAEPVPSAASPASSGAPVAPLIFSGRQSTRPPGSYSPGVAQIIKMLDCKVDTQAILAYVQDSPTAYDPDASELMALKGHGASTELMMALLHHGDELRLRLAQVLNALNAPSVVPANDSPQEAPYPAYAATPIADSGEQQSVAFYGYGSPWPWLGRTPLGTAYRPYWYERGCWYAHRGDAHPIGQGPRGGDPGQVPSVPTPLLVSAPAKGHPSLIAAPSRIVTASP